MKKVYVDYAATTPLDPRVIEAMTPYYDKIYGNASSINFFGLEAREAIENSRKKVADFMNANPKDLIFTGSATEANNLILKGYAFKNKKNTHIAISTIEHDSIINSVKWLAEKGFKISHIPVDKYGLINEIELEKILKKRVSLVSIIHVNNEIGTIQTIKNIGKMCHEYGAFFHIDAAQSFGKIPIDIKNLNIDSMTVNAHKIYGPKGVGAIFIEDELAKCIDPFLHGGGHEFGYRSGTENVPGIIGFSKAIDIRKEEMISESLKLNKFSDKIIKGILGIEDTFLNGHTIKRLPNILNFRFSFIEGESLILLLNEEGIAASTGSACSSRSSEPSHVLLALGLNPEDIHGSLRISLGKYNTVDDVNYILEIVPKAVKKLRDISPLK